MPEFHIDMGSLEGARLWQGLDGFTRGYVEAMFFTSTGSGGDAENDLECASFAELAPEAVERIKRWCGLFQEANREALEEARIGGYDSECAGRDFWYSRCGHGTGFWDRGLGAVGDVLHTAAKARGSAYLYRGNAGNLYTDLG